MFEEKMHDCASQFLAAPSWKKRAAIANGMLEHLHGAGSRLRELGLNDRLKLFDALSQLQDAADAMVSKAEGTAPFPGAAVKGARTDFLKAQVRARKLSSELHGLMRQLGEEPSLLKCTIADIFPGLGTDGHDGVPVRGKSAFYGRLRNFENAALEHIVPIQAGAASVEVRIDALAHLWAQLAKIDDNHLATLPGNEKLAFSDAIKMLSGHVERECKLILDNLSEEDVVLMEQPESRGAEFELKALNTVGQELDRLSDLCEAAAKRPDDSDEHADYPLKDVNLDLFKERMHDCGARFRSANSWKERGSAANDMLDAIDGAESLLHALEPKDKYELLAVLSILQQEVDQKAGEVRRILPSLKWAGRLTNPDLWKAKESLAQASNKLHRLVQQMESEPGSLSHSITSLFPDSRAGEFNGPPIPRNADAEDHIQTLGIVALRHLAAIEGAAAGVQARFALWAYLRSQLARIDQHHLAALPAKDRETFSIVVDKLLSMAWGVAEKNRMVSESGHKAPIEHDEAARPQMKALDPVYRELNRLSLLCGAAPIAKSRPKARIQPDQDMPSIPEHDEWRFGPAEEEMPKILRERTEEMTKRMIQLRKRKPS